MKVVPTAHCNRAKRTSKSGALIPATLNYIQRLQPRCFYLQKCTVNIIHDTSITQILSPTIKRICEKQKHKNSIQSSSTSGVHTTRVRTLQPLEQRRFDPSTQHHNKYSHPTVQMPNKRFIHKHYRFSEQTNSTTSFENVVILCKTVASACLTKTSTTFSLHTQSSSAVQ